MTLAEFRVIYPEFDSVPDEVIQAQLDLFECLYQGDYGCASDHLQGLFAAHQVAIKEINGSAPGSNIITTKSAGDVSVGTGSYLSFTGRNPSYLNATKYGQEFIDLISMYGGGPVMSSCGC